MFKQELMQEIEMKRNLMVKIGNTYGFTSDQTIKVSQELDVLILRYLKLGIE